MVLFLREKHVPPDKEIRRRWSKLYVDDVITAARQQTVQWVSQ